MKQMSSWYLYSKPPIYIRPGLKCHSETVKIPKKPDPDPTFEGKKTQDPDPTFDWKAGYESELWEKKKENRSGAIQTARKVKF